MAQTVLFYYFCRNISVQTYRITKQTELLMISIIADSGSTKTDWQVSTENSVFIISTQGINPVLMDEERIRGIIEKELKVKLKERLTGKPDNIQDTELEEEHYNDRISNIEFYGAGCTPVKIPVMEVILREAFPEADNVIVSSDLLGAAKALCKDKEGIACILGTGANSCLYDGSAIVSNVSPMGFILGDEGSGAVLGKTLINNIYKGVHQEFIPIFEEETGLTLPDIIQKVYREPMPNRYLASLSVFISKHISKESWIEDMVTECFRDFFRKNIIHYNRPDLEVNFVGSIAFYYSEQLKKAANLEGFKIGSIMRKPLMD